MKWRPAVSCKRILGESAALALWAFSLWLLAHQLHDRRWPAAAALIAPRLSTTEAVVIPKAATLEARSFGELPVLAGPDGLPGRLTGVWLVYGVEHCDHDRRRLRARYPVRRFYAPDGTELSVSPCDAPEVGDGAPFARRAKSQPIIEHLTRRTRPRPDDDRGDLR